MTSTAAPWSHGDTRAMATEIQRLRKEHAEALDLLREIRTAQAKYVGARLSDDGPHEPDHELYDVRLSGHLIGRIEEHVTRIAYEDTKALQRPAESPVADYLVVGHRGSNEWFVVHMATRSVLCKCYDEITAIGIAKTASDLS